MLFFDTKGTIISKDQFVDAYSHDYFLLESGQKGLVAGLSRNSNYIEEEIKRVLAKIKNNEEIHEKDVTRILAWKVGKIKHRDSEDAKRFEYYSDWINAEKTGMVVIRKHEVNLNNIASLIINNLSSLTTVAKKNPRKFIEELRAKDLELYNGECFCQIGSVYMLTLLYFLSGAEYPIYDQFAHKAVKAIYFDKKPNQIYVGSAPTKELKSWKKDAKNNESLKYWINNTVNMLEEYMWYLEYIFKKRDISREEDQALWVYGHLK